MKNKGIALTYVILVISLLLSLGIGLASIIFSTTSSLHAQKEELYAFYLAEGALETGKTELDKNPAWYTDLPHHGNIIQWLKTEAKGLQITPKEEYNILKSLRLSSKRPVCLSKPVAGSAP